MIETLAGLKPGKFDTPELVSEKQEKLKQYTAAGSCQAGFSFEDGNHLQRGMQTLFVNAAIQGLDENQQLLPWIADTAHEF